MKEFLVSKSMPICHLTLCDYQLSRYDLACIPLTQRMLRELLTLVKTQQRPQCPKCHFYIDFKDSIDIDQHIESCQPENMIPCEYCYCPTEFTEYDEHCRQCRGDPVGRQEKLIEFILSRTKYPFSIQQIEFFIENKRKTLRQINPLAIVEELAVFSKLSNCFS